MKNQKDLILVLTHKMDLSEIKKEVIGASYMYHKDRDARLESIQIGDLSFRLVRTSDYYQSSFDNYLVKTPREYFDFSYQDVREGRVRLLSTFTLSEIKNSKSRKNFADAISILIQEELHSRPSTLESFL